MTMPENDASDNAGYGYHCGDRSDDDGDDDNYVSRCETCIMMAVVTIRVTMMQRVLIHRPFVGQTDVWEYLYPDLEQL